MRKFKLEYAFLIAMLLMIVLAVFGDKADAKTLNATPSTIAANISAAQPGDTVVLTGTTPTIITINGRKWSPPINLDASAATMRGLVIKSSDGIRIKGGTFPLANGAGPAGYAIWAQQSSNIYLYKPDITGARVAILFDRVTDSEIFGATIQKQITDGIDLPGSKRVKVSYTRCTLSVGNLAHPDCIQIWSRPGMITQDITLDHNYCKGNSQCFTGFNHVRNGINDGGFDRLTITNNIAVSLYPQSIVYAAVRDGTFTGNIAYTMKGAQWQARFSAGCSGKCVIANNVQGIRPGLAMPPEPLPPVLPNVAF